MSNTAFYYYYQTAEAPTPPATPAPVYSVDPAITGAAIVNTANVGTEGVSSDTTSRAHQWQSSADGVGSWADITGATALNYTPTPGLYNLYLRRRETATGPGGSTVAYSNVSAPVTVPAMTFKINLINDGITFVLNELRTVIGQTINVDWGDGTNENFTSTGSTGNQRSHLYSVSGVRTITIDRPDRVTHFDIRDIRTSELLGAQLSLMRNLTNFRVLSISASALQWTVSEAAPMFPLCQYMQIELQAGLVWTVNGDFPPINDVLNLRGLSGLTWVIDAANPIPVATESFTIRECAGVDYLSSAEGCPDLSIVRFENGLTQTEVDKFLQDIYTRFPTRAVTGGTIDLAGGTPANAAPSGVLAAQCPPVTGKARAYELVNDSCGVSANHWASVTTA